MPDIILHTDGGARGNPGPAGIGVVAYDTMGKELFTRSGYLGKQTNNLAEYEALIMGFRGGGPPPAANTEVLVKMDSELIVKQMKGEYRVKDAELKKQYAIVQTLIPQFHSVSFTHIPRQENARADQLANEAMDRNLGHGYTSP